jgi:Cu/Ag efflux protein CusF
VKPAELDFKPNHPPKPWVWWALGVALLAAAASVFFAVQTQQRVAQAGSDLAAQKTQAQSAAKQADAPAPEPPPKAYDRSARELLAQKAHPWPAALRALENTAATGAQVKSIEVQAGNVGVNVEVVVADLSKLVDLLAALNAGETGAPETLQWVVVRADRAKDGLSVRVGLVARMRQ